MMGIHNSVSGSGSGRETREAHFSSISTSHRAENAPRADQSVIVMGILCPEGRRAKRVSAADRAENAPRADQNVLL